MLSKLQKTWAWIFGAMVIIPELLFWFTPLSFLSFLNNFSGQSSKPLAYFLVNPQFLKDHPLYLLFFMMIEWVGVLGLLIISIKSKKKMFVALSVIALLWLSLIIFIGYVIATMNIGM